MAGICYITGTTVSARHYELRFNSALRVPYPASILQSRFKLCSYVLFIHSCLPTASKRSPLLTDFALSFGCLLLSPGRGIIGFAFSVWPTMALLANKAFLPLRRMRCPLKSTHGGCWQRYRTCCRTESQPAIWFLPTGEAMEQAGEQRNDLVLAWTDDTISLDEAHIRKQWPDCHDVHASPNLFL